MPEGYIDGELVTLDDDNFDGIIGQSNEIWLIKFGAPWCYHCNLMLPSWTAAAKELGAKVRFGKIDADANRGLARRFGVTKLPTMKFFNAGYGKSDETIKDYTGGRTQKDIINFASTLHKEFVANPDKYAYEAGSMSFVSDVAADKATEQQDQSSGTSCTLAGDCLIPEFVPDEIKELCTDGGLCIVAFLQDGIYKDSQVQDLGRAMAGLTGVSVYWLERGSKAECESQLNLSYATNAVIAFEKDRNTFKQMEANFSKDNVRNFITSLQRDGFYGDLQPDGGIKLLQAN